MTARKKGGASASQFVITMDDGDDTEESSVVGRLKATTRTSEEFQVCILGVFLGVGFCLRLSSSLELLMLFLYTRQRRRVQGVRCVM